MTAKEYIEKVVEVSSYLTGIDREEILGQGKIREVVDARWMVIRLMRDAGYYPTQIAPLMKMSVRNVQNIASTFADRMDYSEDPMLRNNYEAAAKQLRSICEVTD